MPRTPTHAKQPAVEGDPSTEVEQRSQAERLAPGALRGMIEDYLRGHASEAFGPNAIGKALARSSGVVHNALEKLVTNGYAVRTSDKPKKYSLAPAEPAGSPAT